MDTTTTRIIIDQVARKPTKDGVQVDWHWRDREVRNVSNARGGLITNNKELRRLDDQVRAVLVKLVIATAGEILGLPAESDSYQASPLLVTNYRRTIEKQFREVTYDWRWHIKSSAWHEYRSTVLLYRSGMLQEVDEQLTECLARETAAGVSQAGTLYEQLPIDVSRETSNGAIGD